MTRSNLPPDDDREDEDIEKGDWGASEESSRSAISPEPEDTRAPRDSGDPVIVPIESEIDLHSFLPEEMESVVESYLEEALRAGLTEVRIIHGKGIGVQREMVRRVLSRSANVLSFGDAPSIFGGRGATIAVLRR